MIDSRFKLDLEVVVKANSLVTSLTATNKNGEEHKHNPFLF